MKKITALLLSCMLMILITACGGNNASSNSNAEATASEEIIIKATNYAFDKEEYRIKKGVPVKVTFVNEEGNHGILVPGLNLNLDNKKTSKVITPDKVGEFEVSCSVFCGSGHGAMISKIVVEE